MLGKRQKEGLRWAPQASTGGKMALVKILAHELEVNTPLNFRVYSAAGKLLLSEGNSLRSDSQCERLLEIGVFRDGAAAAGKPNNASAENTMLISTAAHLTAKQPAPEPVSVRGFPSLPTGIEQFQLTLCEAQGAPFHVQYVGVIPECALLITTEGETEALKIGTEVDAKVICGRAVARASQFGTSASQTCSSWSIPPSSENM